MKPVASKWACAFVSLLTVIVAALVFLAPSKLHRTAPSTQAASALQAADTRARVQAGHSAIPLAFEPNQGQTDAQVKYLARGDGYTLFLTPNDAVFSLYSRSADRAQHRHLAQTPARPRSSADSSAVVRMQLVGAKSEAAISGSSQMSGVSNYFLGNDPSKWRTGVPRFARVSYQDVYPGVDMAFHGAQRHVEFDFVVAPNASPAPIAFQFTGAKGLTTDDSGNLLVSSAAGNVLLHKPVAYQEQQGTRRPVDARFVLKANHEVSFVLGNYDRSRELVIDPSVSVAYSTYLGGSLEDDGLGIAADSSGSAYVTGQTASADFPKVAGGVSGTNAGGFDVFVTKFAPDGSSLIYSTFVGGSKDDSGNAITVDASGNAFVVGGTSSSNFPTTTGAFQTTLKAAANSFNAFAFELNSSGSALTYSTYIGGTGSDVALGVALASDGSGDIFLVGKTSSTDFPTQNPNQIYLTGSTLSGFVTKLNATGTAPLVYSTYLGGSAVGDLATSVAVDSSDNAYVTGQTFSPTFPTLNAFQPVCGSCAGGQSNAFVTAFNPAGSAYVFSTFLGGGGTDSGFGIAVDSTGVYVTGTTSSSSFPFTAGALQTTYGGGTDAFVTKFKPDGSGHLYSTFLGGSAFDGAGSIAVDGNGNAYVTGETFSNPFPTLNPTQSSFGGAQDAFVSEINPSGSNLVFSTYLGGSGPDDASGDAGAIAVDSAANIYVTGNTAPPQPPGTPNDFPVQAAEQSAGGGGTDAFVVKYSQGTSGTFSLSATTLSPASVSPGTPATSTVTVTPGGGFSGTVTLGCTVSPVVTLGPTCSGSASATTPGTLTVNTTPATAMLRGTGNHFSYAMWLPFAGILLTGMTLRPIRSRKRKLLGFLMLGMIMASMLLMPACGGSSSHSGGGSPGTPAGTYTITVTGTATGATQTGTPPALTLTVQ